MGGHSPSNDSGSSDAPNTKRSKVTKVRGEGGIVDFFKKGGVTGAVIRGVGKHIGEVKEQNRRNKLTSSFNSEEGVKPTLYERDNDNDGSSANSIVQPKVKSQMNNKDVKSTLITATGPTDIEMATTTELSEDEKLLKRKRGKKTKTILSSVTGDNSKATLSNKTLLG